MPEIDELNEIVRCTLKPSKIHGIGVFAMRDILEGEKLYCRPDELKMYSIPYTEFKDLRPEVRNLIESRWPRVVEEIPFVLPDVLLISFMNHSIDANYDPKTDCALRNISKGEEITEDYRILSKKAQKLFSFL